MESGERDPRGIGLDLSEHGHQEIDETLRRLLEPHPLAVERLVKNALDGRVPRPALAGARWWAGLGAAAAALVLLLTSLNPDPSPGPPASSDSAAAVASAEPARISISNSTGYVTISTTRGSKWILVPGDDS